MWLASKKDASLMLDKHDRNRIDTREMLGRTVRTGPRPSAANDFAQMTAIRAEAMARVPPRKAERGGEERSLGSIELSDERQDAERSSCRLSKC